MTAVWWLEWRLALTDVRRFVLSALVPLLIAASVATGVAAPAPAAGVYLVIFVSFAVFGSALPLRWDGERGLAGRIVRGGVPAGRYLLSRAAAGAAIDLVQLTPALVVAAVVAGGSAAAFLEAFAALAVALWLGGLVGVFAAAISRSLAETGLVAALAVLVLAHSSGVFEDPAPGSALAMLEALSPFRVLHESLLEMTVGASAVGIGTALVWALLLPALVWLLGDRIVAALGRVSRGGLEGV
ncbi:MAG TPA: ABC transporter permease [Longimicrobiales bacterium]|nr:ABC transporter permease [Longimicrobiales bacterium]